MSSLAKSISADSYTKSNIVVTLVVLLVVISLFFIPEILDFRRSGPAHRTTALNTEEAREVERAEEAVETVESTEGVHQQDKSPLALVSELIDSGYIERRRAANAAISEKSGEAPADPNVSPREALSRRFASPGVTWEEIRSAESRAVFSQAHDQALQLAAAIPATNLRLRYALYSYAAGIQSVLDSDGMGIKPSEALDYIATLDAGVGREMVRDGISSEQYQQWTQISLGSLFDARSAILVRRAPYLPRVQLGNVSMTSSPGPNENYPLRRPAYVSFDVVISAKNLDKVGVYGDGQLVNEPWLEGTESDGLKGFHLNTVDGWKVYTIKVHSKSGETYEKSYRFFPRATSFSVRPDSRVELPFARISLNPAVDRLFTYHGNQSGAFVGGGDTGNFSRF